MSGVSKGSEVDADAGIDLNNLAADGNVDSPTLGNNKSPESVSMVEAREDSPVNRPSKKAVMFQQNHESIQADQ